MFPRIFTDNESNTICEENTAVLLSILNSSSNLSPRKKHERPFPEVESISQISPRIVNACEEDFAADKDFDNLVALFSYGKENEVVKYIGTRYLIKKFYTWIGQVLLAVNPYEEHKLIHKKNKKKTDLVPSIKSVVHTAWFKLCFEIGQRKDQSIVISGDSGSGKTFSACTAIKHVFNKEFEMTNSKSYQNIILQAWSTVPLLSAFGNACTSWNNNSSRFGKLLQLQYVDSKLVGANVCTYMLEKSRVTRLNDGEGNFHIFWEILENLDEESLEDLCLNKNTAYKIAPKVTSVATYKDVMQALENLKIYEFKKVIKILSIILNLGNIGFQSNGDTFIIDPETQKFAENVAKLLGTPRTFLDDILCTVRFTVNVTNRRDSIYKAICNNIKECEDRRDCLIKYLYQSIFNWLVKTINTIINFDNFEGDIRNLRRNLLMSVFRPRRQYFTNQPCNPNQNSPDILDIYGFETVNNNTFEQLCINYANERLLQFYAKSFLLEKQMELMNENLWIGDIDIKEYDERVLLMDGHISVFGILNEECEVKRFNNDHIVNTRIVDALRGRPHFVGPLNDYSTTFTIKHYAGLVEYNSKGMLAKNKDKVPDDVIGFLKECKFEFLREIIDEKVNNKRTTLSNFKKSLDSLIDTLNNSEVHYIKCLKPNQFQISGFFDEGYFTQQMEANAIFETFKINNLQKYPIRMNLEPFLQQFPKRLSQEISEFSDEEIHMGNKFIYFTENGYYLYQKVRQIRKNIAARKLQRFFKTIYEKRNNSAVIIQRCKNFYPITTSYKIFRTVIYKRNFRFCEKFIDLSKKSSELCITLDKYKPLRGQFASTFKICEYLKRHDFKKTCEGDRLSLVLEKVFESTETKPFHRTLFTGDRIVSYRKVSKIPLRLHTSKTCIKYSNYLPRSEFPEGLLDIL